MTLRDLYEDLDASLSEAGIDKGVADQDAERKARVLPFVDRRLWDGLAKKIGAKVSRIEAVGRFSGPGYAEVLLSFSEKEPRAGHDTEELRALFNATKEPVKISFILYRGRRRGHQKYKPISGPGDIHRELMSFLRKKWRERSW